MRNLFLSIVFLSLGFVVNAQTLQQRYQQGKEMYNSGKYGLAQGVFQSLAKETTNNPYVEYASFFYALSAYHEGYVAYARDMLLQMKIKYPTWEKIDDVNYWLAKLDFENRKFDSALKIANEIKNKNVAQDARLMKLNFLNQIESVDSLQLLINKHSSDTVLARLTADKIMDQPIVHRDMKVLDELIKKYNLNRSKYEIAVPENSVKKREYQVAVMFPFMYKEFAGSAANRKNFIYELYEGIKLASQELRDQGVNIKIFAYDSRRDSVYTNKLLSNSELKAMDLIIGPIFSEEINVTSTFSYNQKINMINPVSTNSQVVGKNPYSFLFLSSLETQASQAAKFAAQNFNNKRNVLIVYGESQRDSVLAHNYRNSILEEGFKVMAMRKVKKQHERDLFRLLTSTTERVGENGSSRVEYVIPRDSIGHVYVASDNDDEMIATYLISALESRGEYVKVLGHEEWLDYTSIIPEQLERLQVHMVAPTYIDYSMERYKQFREKYLNQTFTLPTKFSSLGYDMMMFYGSMLQNHGVHFQVNFDEMGFKEGVILPGYLYKNAQDNQYVPIIRFIDSELVNVNNPNTIK